MGPIADAVLYGDGATAQNKVAQYGEDAFATLTSTYVLTEPVRQDKASEFYQQLHAVRSGQIDDEAAAFWNGRQKLHLPSAQKALFDHVQTDGLLVLTCTRLERSAVNLDYVRGLRKVCRVNAVVSGKHAQNDKDRDVGMCKSIPICTVFAIGMKVKLTVNICDRWGLCNGSRGTIVDIIYPNDAGYVPPPPPSREDDTVFPIVIVDFPDYCGSQVLHAQRRTLVPIVSMERKCNAAKKCCFRRGLPLVCCFDTIKRHSRISSSSTMFSMNLSHLKCTFVGVWQG